MTKRGAPITSVLGLLLSLTLAQGGDWPQWHGPTRDGALPKDESLPESLPAEAQPLWQIPIGGGHSSPVVARDRLIYLDENGEQEVARAVSTENGGELWAHPFAPRFEDEWGAGPRSTPAIDGNSVFALSCNGEFRCLDLATGRVRWESNFERDFGVKFLGAQSNRGVASRRGNNGSPLVDGDSVIVPVGAEDGATLVCFDKQNGQVRWRVGEDEAAYSSPMMATFDGIRQVVYLSADALMGVDRGDGSLLWRMPLRTVAQRHAATPATHRDKVIVNSHTFGMAAFRINRTAEVWDPQSAWQNRALRVNLATPVIHGESIYTQGADRDYVCVDVSTGELRWSRRGYGRGRRDYASTLVGRDRLLVLTEDGTLTLLQADEQRYRELGRLQVCGNTWSFPAWSNGRLYVRDGRQLQCLVLGDVTAVTR